MGALRGFCGMGAFGFWCEGCLRVFGAMISLRATAPQASSKLAAI